MKLHRGPVVISVIYFCFGFLWILVSDTIVTTVAPHPEVYRHMQTWKGWIYVVITTILIYILLSIYAQRKDRALEELRMRQRDIAEGLEEKNELIRELHHRVKNNLKLVLSMIRLTDAGDRGKSADLLPHLAGRVFAISAIQESIFAGEQYAQVSVGRFIQDILHFLCSLSGNSGCPEFLLEMEEKDTLSIQQAVPFGIIFEELVSNALRHAFLPEEGGTITIRLEICADIMKLTVADNGKGWDTEAIQEGVGLSIAREMAKQISGTLLIEPSDKGTYATLTLSTLLRASTAEKDRQSAHR